MLTSKCSNNYGPYQFPEKLVPLRIVDGLEGRPLPLSGDGLQVRDWIAVEDHLAALAMILERSLVGDIYMVGARSERTNRAVVETTCAALDRLRPEAAPHYRLITLTADRPGHDRCYAIDPIETERALGFAPKAPLVERLEAAVSWHAANEAWWRPLRGRYAGERLGPSSTQVSV